MTAMLQTMMAITAQLKKPTALIQTAPPRETARHHRKMKLLMLKDGTKKQTPKNSP